MDRRQFLAGLGASLGAASISCGDNRAAPESPDARAPAAAGACAPSELSASQLLAGIDAIVVLCLENRSFDHTLGALRLIEGRADVDGLTGAEVNLDDGGNAVAVHPIEDFTAHDPPHNRGACPRQWHNGPHEGCR